MIKPYDFDPSKKYPLIIRIHGGPVSQYDLSFLERHFLRQQQVVAVNQRAQEEVKRFSTFADCKY